MDTLSVRQHRVCESRDAAYFPVVPSPTFLIVLVQVPLALIVCFDALSVAEAQESGHPLTNEFYVGAFATRSNPTGSDISLGGDKIPQASFSSSTGGGIKGGIFPKFFRSYLGGEIEAFGHGGTIRAPQTVSGGVTRSADLNMAVVTVIGNLIARYPGDLFQPYVGAGLGWSYIGLSGRTQSSAGLRTSPDQTFGITVQALVGLRLILTNHFFGFAEYKYAYTYGEGDDGCDSANKSCQPLPIHALDFQRHYISLGVGFRF